MSLWACELLCQIGSGLALRSVELNGWLAYIFIPRLYSLAFVNPDVKQYSSKPPTDRRCLMIELVMCHIAGFWCHSVLA
jgi:hypothetical protein